MSPRVEVVSTRRDSKGREVVTFRVTGAEDEAKWAETKRLMGYQSDAEQRMTFALHPRYPDAVGSHSWDTPSSWPSLFFVDAATYSMHCLTPEGREAVDAALAEREGRR